MSIAQRQSDESSNTTRIAAPCPVTAEITGPSQPEDTDGVQLGMSDGTGGTFEPEEDPVEDVEP